MARSSTTIANGDEAIIKELIEFKKNFSLGSVNAEEMPATSTTTGIEEAGTSSAPDISSLKEFYQSFKLATSNKHMTSSTTSSVIRPAPCNAAPSTLNISSNNGRINSKRKKLKKKLIEDGDYKFSDVYDITDESLGVGAVSSVNVCIKRSTHVRYAVKIVNKSSLEVRDRVLKEVEILYACSTSKLFLKLEDFFETNESFYLVFDKMAGPLLALIQKRERFTEREASLVTREVASGLAFLHERGIAHRDLKPENILCEKANEVVPIKICDFDLSSMITNQSTTTPNLFTPVGSAEYMAPEVVDIFRGDTFSYDKKCDLWSLGVLLYMMLSGSPPFNAKCLKDCGWERGMSCEDCQVMLMKKITAGDYTFPQEIWGKISSEAKDLISKLLEINAERRLSANETLRHAWLNEAAVIPDTPLTTPKVLKRYSSIPEELSLYAASCLKCNRQVSEREQINGRFFALSPPGNSNLAIRRERKDTPPNN